MLGGLRLACRRVQAIAALSLASALAFGTANAQKSAISFVQVNAATPLTPQNSVSVAYAASQAAGDLNVVVVGWSNSTATISSIADSAGNTYAVAIGPTVQSSTATQTIYYAKNIRAAAANTNSVTVTFSAPANYPDIRIAEYSGLDPSNPLDVAVAAQGTSTSSSSGSATTSNANDLLVGANLVQTVTKGAGTGYTSRVITSPDGDILEDRVVTTTGSYSATAPVSPSGKWIMQMVAFRAASGGVAASPSISSLSPSSGPVGTSVTVTGTNFGATQGSSTVTFNGVAAAPTSWSAASIVAPVPTGATTGNVVVTVGGVASNGVPFTVSASVPSITSLSPSSGPVGASVTITGTNFGATQGTSTVTFNGVAAAPTNWSATSIVAPAPTGATTGNVVVTVGGVASNGVPFTVSASAPSITSLSPTSGPVGTSVTITGTNFGSTQGTSTVMFSGTTASPTSWSATSIVAPAPNGATTGNVVVTVSGVASNGVNFTVTDPAAISFVQVSSAVPAAPQTSVTATYTKAQTAGDLNVVAVGWSNSTATISSIADSAGNTYAVAVGPTVQSGTATQAMYYAKNIVAAAANTNRVTVTFSAAANYPDLRIAEYSGLDLSSPLDVAVAAQGSSKSSSSGSVATTNANDLLVGADLVQTTTSGAGTGYTSRVITSPDGDILEDQIVATAGSYSATAPISPSGKWIMQMVAFRAAQSGASMSPNITNVSPSSGPVGTSVTITGTNFGSTQGTSTVTFNGTTASPTNWSGTSIVSAVPTGATTGYIVVTVGGVASYGVPFTVSTSAPSITGLNPTSGPVGTSVTITGTNFGSTQGTSVVTFNGTAASPTNWSATTIVAAVPSGATTGNVMVTVGGQASNGVSFTVPGPTITSLSPNLGPVGTSETISGTNFGSTQGTSTVTFNGTAGSPTSWTGTSIVVAVPNGASTGNVVVTVGGQASNGVSFTVTTTTSPTISNLTPASGPVGASVTIAGINFGATQGASAITFNGTIATPTSWSATSIVVPVPAEATTGNVVVTVGGQASNGANFTVSVISTGDPTLIQHVSSSSTRGISMGSPFCYYFQLPNPTTSGNAVIVGFTFGSDSMPTVADDQGDSYTIEENYYDSTNMQSVGIAAAFNVSPGARNISLCFSSDPGQWVQPMATEFNNVVAVDGSGTGSQGTGTSVTAGTLTPAMSGDLAYQIVFDLSTNRSSFSAGSQGNITWNLLSADVMDGWAGQYGVYNSTSAINPVMGMGTSQKWLSAAILLQTGTAGSIPSGMRIVHLVHENIPIHEASGGNGSFPNPMPLQLPSSGNLLVAMIGGGFPSSETVTSMTDTNNNVWSQAGSTFVTPDTVTVQTYFAGNAISSSNLGLTLNWSGTNADYTILFYDVTGAATSPLDTTNGATGFQSSTSGTLTVPYTLTPAQPGELIFTNIMWDANTGTGLTSSTGTSYFDTNMFSGESLSGPEPVDENNGWGHVISTSTSAISFTWSQLSTTLPAGNWASMAVAFLAANPPGN